MDRSEPGIGGIAQNNGYHAKECVGVEEQFAMVRRVMGF